MKRTMFQRVIKDRVCLFCIILLILFGSAAMLAPWLSPNDPNEIHYTAKFAGMSGEFPLGADHMGRCILSRILYGARLSLGYAVLITAVSAVIGTLLGMVSGCTGGIPDRTFMGICDAVRAFPGIVIVLVVVSLLGTGLFHLCLGMLATRWVWYARVARNLTKGEREKNAVLASIMSGSGRFKVIASLIFPAIRMQMLAVMTINFGMALTALAGYSFLGFGASPPSPEWGMMIQDGRSFISTSPSMMFWPGLCILAVVIITNCLGDRIQEIAGRMRR